MSPHTRRRLLQGLVGTAVGLAGCPGGTNGPGDGTPTATVERRRNRDDDRARAPYRTIRGTTDGAVAWFADNEDGTPATAVGREEGRTTGVVASETTAGTMRFLDVEGAEAAQSFVGATDFDSETVYLEQRRVGACYALDLCWVSWEGGEIETSYGRRLRDHDVACEADARHTVAVLARLPTTLDPERARSSGSRMSSRGCRPVDRPEPRPAVGRSDPRPAARRPRGDGDG